MRIEKYEKPRLKFVSLRNENVVAATCWGHAGKGTRLYCDISGEGYLSFQIGEGSCSLNLINVLYHKDENDQGTGASASQIATLESVLRASGGSSGNPYAGEGSVVLPGAPDISWS